MKKFIYRPLILLFALMATAGCFQDKSSLDTNKIDQVTIESPNIPDIIRVDYLQEVNFEVTVRSGSQTNPENFSYKWEINETPGSTEFVELGAGRVLKATLRNSIISVAYTLVFTARDELHGLEYQKVWPLYVSSAFREGIVVASTRDGSTSDISLVMDNSITTAYDRGENVIHNIWKTATDNALPSLVKNITYTMHRPSALLTKNLMTVITADKDIKMYDCQDYSVYKTADMIFPARNSSFDPQAFYTINNQYWGLVSNNKLYMFATNQGITAFLLPVSGTNYVNNAMIIPDNTNGSGPYAFWLNNQDGQIYNVAMTFTTPATGGAYTNSGSFNPSALTGREIIAGDVSMDGVTATMLCKTTQGNYEIYAMTFSFYDDNWNMTPSIPKLKADMPAGLNSILNEAVSVFFNMFDPVMYVATSTKLYAVNFGGGVVNYAEKYSAPAGEQITGAKLFVQGRYRLNRKDFNTTSGPIYEAPLALNTKAVVVATQGSGNSGNIYVIPQSNTATGDLNTASAKKYTGFGKILDFTFQGQ